MQHRGLGTISVKRRGVEKTMGEGWGAGREKVGGGRKECVCGRVGEGSVVGGGALENLKSALVRQSLAGKYVRE